MAEDMMPRPSVCRMIHFREEGVCIAAVVTEVISDEKTGTPTTNVGLRTFPPDNDTYAGMSPYRFNVPEGVDDGTWHWPERV
jgi:hypothetical protein